MLRGRVLVTHMAHTHGYTSSSLVPATIIESDVMLEEKVNPVVYENRVVQVVHETVEPETWLVWICQPIHVGEYWDLYLWLGPVSITIHLSKSLKSPRYHRFIR